MTKNYKSRRLNEIKEMIHGFCENHLNEELEGYAIKLCEDLSRKRKISIERGRKDIWAASIIHVIARLNFLFDEENDYYIAADTICVAPRKLGGLRGLSLKKDIANGEWGQSLKGDKFNIWPNQLIQRTR